MSTRTETAEAPLHARTTNHGRGDSGQRRTILVSRHHVRRSKKHDEIVTVEGLPSEEGSPRIAILHDGVPSRLKRRLVLLVSATATAAISDEQLREAAFESFEMMVPRQLHFTIDDNYFSPSALDVERLFRFFAFALLSRFWAVPPSSEAAASALRFSSCSSSPPLAPTPPLRTYAAVPSHLRQAPQPSRSPPAQTRSRSPSGTVCSERACPSAQHEHGNSYRIRCNEP